MWTYRARLDRIKDADSWICHVDLGFKLTLNLDIRVLGVDAPETNTTAGRDATRWAQRWHDTHNTTPWPLTITTTKPNPLDKYGRWLGTIHAGPDNYAADLLAAGHATPRLTAARPKPTTAPPGHPQGALSPETGTDSAPPAP